MACEAAWKYIASVLIVIILGAGSSAKCRFPKEWKGRWYQSGLGDIIIRSNSIQRKGDCLEHHRDYFLMENEDDKCVQCLLMMKRHRNIIQYKESFCMPPTELRTVCQMIKVETILFTLVREPTTPIPPPFEDSYKVDFDDGHGFCEDPNSTAKPCPGQDKVNFHFNHCRGSTLWPDNDLSFEVLATWKDGSDTFMYGRFDISVIGTKDSSYRCFKYEHYGPDLYMAMSADATCRALRSPRDGPITMRFVKDVMGRPEPRCTFPSWVANGVWSDLADKYRYSLDDAGSTLSLMRHWVEDLVGDDEGSTEVLQSQTGCLDIHQDSTKGGEVIVSGFSTQDCNIRYQCLKFRSIKDGVLALYVGKVTSEVTDVHHCRRQLNHNNDFQILMDLSRPIEPVLCPLAGQYHIPGVSDNCDAHLDLGCRNSSTLDLSYSCSPRSDRLGCLHTWTEENNTFLITSTDPTSKSSPNCWVFSYTDRQLRIDTDTCNQGAISSLPYTLKHNKLFKTDCDGSSALPESKEPERIIIDRDQTIDEHSTLIPPKQPRPPDPSRPLVPRTVPPRDSDRDTGNTLDQSEKSLQDSMYRTSSLAVTSSQPAFVILLSSLILGQFFIQRFCCR